MSKKYLISFFVILSGFVSCRNETDSPDITSRDEDVVLIGGKTGGLLYSRGEYETDDDGNVKDGTFYLTYPTTASTTKSPQYKRLYVDFSKSKYYEKYQRYYAFTEGRESGSELTNAMIGSTPNTLFLDNVPPESPTADQDTIVIFSNQSKYGAGLMTSEKDIVWGSVQKHTSNRYDFDLHHVMAGVRVKVTVDASVELVDKYDLSKAQIYLTNIVNNPYSFCRTNGNVEIPVSPEYKNLILVNNYESGVNDLPEPGENPLGWSSSEMDDSNPVYLTQDFILPPQTPTDDYWPELVVRFPNPSPEEVEQGKTYKEFYGKVPRGMFTDYPEGTNYGMDISFLREHILEIRTMISQNPPQLIFMPVKVYDWVNWGPYTIIGHQEGVYSVRQLLDIISYYEIYNPKMLERYGELRDSEDIKKWVFKIFQNLTVSLEEIKGKMQQTSSQEYGVAFELNNHRVTVVDNDGKKLYTITSNSEFTALITEGAEPATNH